MLSLNSSPLPSSFPYSSSRVCSLSSPKVFQSISNITKTVSLPHPPLLVKAAVRCWSSQSAISSELTLSQTINWLQSGQVSSAELLQQCLLKVEECKHLNAFISLQDPQSLMERAHKADERRKKGNSYGVLDGICLAVKDNFCVKDTVTSCGSNMLSNFVAPYTAFVCEQLEKSGGLIIGKTNMDEFAMGSLTKTSRYGPTINPYPELRHKTTGDWPAQRRAGEEVNKRFSPGGSSGGSAVAVATSQCYGSLGSDTGGSVRLPAAWCNIVGLKPSYGRCSRHGLVSYASSLDTPAIFSKTVEDSAVLLDVISGFCDQDSTSLRTVPPLGNFEEITKQYSTLQGITVGVPLEYNVEELPVEFKESWQLGIDFLRSHGAHVKEVSLPHTRYALPAYYIIAPAEASSNLARYDGLKYGLRTDLGGTPTGTGTTKEVFMRSRDEGFGEEVKRRILVGSFVLSRESYKDYFLQATKIRRLVRDDFSVAFKEVDVLLTPTATGFPPEVAGDVPTATKLSPVEEYLNDVMTIPASIAGVPAISVPVGFSSSHFPIGLQLIGNYLEERKLLAIAHILEKSNKL